MLSVHNELPVINSTLAEGALGYIQKMLPFPKFWKGSIPYMKENSFYAHKPGLYWRKSPRMV